MRNSYETHTNRIESRTYGIVRAQKTFIFVHRDEHPQTVAGACECSALPITIMTASRFLRIWCSAYIVLTTTATFKIGRAPAGRGLVGPYVHTPARH